MCSNKITLGYHAQIITRFLYKSREMDEQINDCGAWRCLQLLVTW